MVQLLPNLAQSKVVGEQSNNDALALRGADLGDAVRLVGGLHLSGVKYNELREDNG